MKTFARYVNVCHLRTHFSGFDEIFVHSKYTWDLIFRENTPRHNTLWVNHGKSIPVQVFSGKSGGSTHQKHVRFPKGAIFRKSLHTERMLFSKGHMWGMFGTYTRWAHAILWFALSWTLDSSFGSRFLGACDFLDDSLKACWIVLPKQGGLCTLIFPECWGVQICAVCDFLRRKT